jgi:hypothetical protein
MKKKMVEFITSQTIMINNAQIYFSFKDKGKEMRLQIHSLIGNELTLIYNLSAAYFIASTKSLMSSAKLFVDEANVSWLFIRLTGLKLSCSDT